MESLPDADADDNQLERSRSFKMSAVLKVMKADLTKNFESYGRMDPYAVVHWTGAEETFELTKTRVDWNAHMNPVWEHTCRPQYFEGFETVRIEVLEANVTSKATLCGEVTCKFADLVKTPSTGPSPKKAAQHPETQLILTLNGEETGTVSVEAMLVPLTNNSRPSLTRIDPILFETPVKRLGVSGGTAPFFKLVLRKATAEKSIDYYIGKDLSRASDEVDFYEMIKLCQEAPSAAGLMPLLNYTFDYAGVVELHEEGQEKKKPIELLVLQNLRDGRQKLRLLDIKIGQQTAQAGWQGKSHAAALRQAVVDGLTNSAGEGFRLEGFDGQPATLTSMDPLLDLGKRSEKMAKKALRIMLQRMTSASMLMFYLDLMEHPLPSTAALEHELGRAETAEVVLHETLVKVTGLAVACMKCPVPQKWIGSSVALGFDIGQMPKRGEEEKFRQKIIVSIFDWGRSELNTIEKNASLSADQQHDRGKYWRFYSGGILRLSWEVARAYYHRFCNVGGWERVALMLYDFDSQSDNDFMGKVDIPLEPTHETTEFLELNPRLFRLASGVARTEWRCWKRVPKMTYSIEWIDAPSTSRLEGVWRVKVVKASHLPREDLYMFKGSSDPFVEVVAYCENGFSFRQRSTTKIRTLNPCWGEIFELPVAKSDKLFKDALADFDIIPEELGTLFPPEKPQAEMLHEKVRRSSKKEDGVSPTKSTSDPFHEWEVLIAKTAREEVSEEIPAGPTSPEDPEDQLNTEDLATEIQAPRLSAQDGYCFSCGAW